MKSSDSIRLHGVQILEGKASWFQLPLSDFCLTDTTCNRTRLNFITIWNGLKSYRENVYKNSYILLWSPLKIMLRGKLKSSKKQEFSSYWAAFFSDNARIRSILCCHSGYAVSHLVRSQVLTAESMKMVMFQVVVSCSPVKFYGRFRCASCLHHQGDSGGSKHIWNVGKLLSDRKAQRPWYSWCLSESTDDLQIDHNSILPNPSHLWYSFHPILRYATLV